MASAAGLCKQAGYTVSGSDYDTYPPMSTMLENLRIPVTTPYSPDNIHPETDLYIIGNALSKANPEVAHILANDLPFTSFPQFLGENLLGKNASIVVAGTHGKTTTTSFLSYLLHALGHKPSYLVGGIPKNFSTSYNYEAAGNLFVLEGDEYDTAFFDKGSKFLHYRPEFVILGNIEFDHADIFPNIESIESSFQKLLTLVPNPANIVANTDSPRIHKILKGLNIREKVTSVSVTADSAADVSFDSDRVRFLDGAWCYGITSKVLGQIRIRTEMPGQYNAWNIAHALGCIGRLVTEKRIPMPTQTQLENAISKFLGVKRRFEHLGQRNGVDFFEDFAHHPTAIREVLTAVRQTGGDRRLIVAFEPRSATSRRNIFEEEFSQSLNLADIVLIGQPYKDSRLSDSECFSSSRVAAKIGSKAHTFDDNLQIKEWLDRNCQPGDRVVLMSCGSFSNLQKAVLEQSSTTCSSEIK